MNELLNSSGNPLNGVSLLSGFARHEFGRNVWDNLCPTAILFDQDSRREFGSREIARGMLWLETSEDELRKGVCQE
jgi:hypothetical protein